MILRQRAYSLLVTAILLAATGHAQTLRFSHLTQRDGLSDNNVLCMLRDSRGFLWAGTAHGLNCYDGYSVTRFFWQPGNPQSLAYNRVCRIAEDGQGNIWLALARNGVQCYNPATKRWTSFRHKEGDARSLASEQVNEVYADSRGRIWIGYWDLGWSMYEPATARFRHFRSRETQINQYGFNASNIIDGFAEDRTGNMWVASNYGLHYTDLAQGKVTSYLYPAGGFRMENLFTYMMRGAGDTLWLGSWGGGLKAFNTRTRTFSRYLYNTTHPVREVCNIVIGIAPKGDTALWLATADTGLAVFNIPARTFRIYPHDPSDPASTPPGGITSLLADSAGTLWTGSGYGISRTAYSRQPFRYQATADVVPELIGQAYSTAFFKAGTKVYYGMVGGKGLYETDETTGRTRIISLSGTREQYISDILPVAASGDLLLRLNGRLCRYRRSADRIGPVVTKDAMGHVLPLCAQLLPAGAGGFWYRSYDYGLYFIPAADASALRRYDSSAASPVPVAAKGATMLLAEGDSVLWFHTRDLALFRLNRLRNKVEHMSISRELDGPIMLRSMLRNSNGSYTAISEQMGVFCFRFSGTSSTYDQLTTAQGLPSDYCEDLMRDLRGDIWVMTQAGPAVMQGVQFAAYDEDRGWQRSWGGGTIYQASDSTFYFGARKGYFRSDYAALRRISAPLRIFITSLKIFDKEWNDSTDLNSLSTVRLSYDQNFISVSFVAPSLLDAAHTQYAWMLEGLDKTWVTGGDKRYASYSGLQPGRYTLRIKASDADGIWHERAVPLHVTIAAPFWKTWWFYGFCALLVSGVVISLYRYRVRDVRRREAERTAFNKHVAEIEMKALRAQMNPHFIFNCLNAINRYIVMSDQVTAADYVAKFAKLIRLILDNSHNATTSLDRELQMLRLYLEMESLRFSGKFSYQIEAAAITAPESLRIPSMLIQPYIENAIWHGLLHKSGGGEVRISVKEEPAGTLVVAIEDNGIGRKAAAALKSGEGTAQKSYGMKITGERLRMLHELRGKAATIDMEDLYDEGAHAAGTRAVLRIPVERT